MPRSSLYGSMILWYIPVASKDVGDPATRTAAISLRRK